MSTVTDLYFGICLYSFSIRKDGKEKILLDLQDIHHSKIDIVKTKLIVISLY